MAVTIGIIGLAKSGRTTIFNAATRSNAATGSYSQSSSANVGIVKVPDARLTPLEDMFHPKKLTPAEIKYFDVGASLKGGTKDSSFSGELLTQLQNVDALLNVIRAFEDTAIPLPAGGLNAERDLTTMNAELIFSDLTIIEKRLNRIGSQMKGAKPPERAALEREKELMARIKEAMEKDIPARDIELDEEEAKILSGYQFLSSKPVLMVINIGEDDLPKAAEMEAELNGRYGGKNYRVIVMCGKLEAELINMDEAEAAEFRSSYGLKETGLDRTIRASYELLDLISFFTVGPDEVRAWTITRGTIAQKAAGKIHSDIERGFIRAEIVHVNDLLAAGSLAEVRKRGQLRLEGKTYLVQDGDTANFLFNV